MNFLAHFYLAGDDEGLIIGNFIADSVKGRQYLNYNEKIAKGILLHRYIDTFTDTHPIVEKSKLRLRQDYGKFAGIITDIFYDYFLAINWKQYSSLPLPLFAKNMYSLLLQHKELFPEFSKLTLLRMVQQNWLVNYSTLHGIERALSGLSKRTRFDNNMQEAITNLNLYLSSFEEEFNLFFPHIIREVKLIRQTLV